MNSRKTTKILTSVLCVIIFMIALGPTILSKGKNDILSEELFLPQLSYLSEDFDKIQRLREDGYEVDETYDAYQKLLLEGIVEEKNGALLRGIFIKQTYTYDHKNSWIPVGEPEINKIYENK